MLKTRFAIGTLFLVGCMTGGVASQMVVPPARAGQPTQVWEYFCLYASGPIDSAKSFNEAGLQGWELVAFREGFACMKRPRG